MNCALVEAQEAPVYWEYSWILASVAMAGVAIAIQRAAAKAGLKIFMLRETGSWEVLVVASGGNGE
jgi:hypothetical protein